jgi:Tfp pilus assembly protein PilN
MIQFNLLPDIKIQYLKAKRQEHAVILGATVAIIASVTVFVLLLVVVHGLQKKNLRDLGADIASASQELKNTPELTKILTVQNQLTSLPDLHSKKAVSSRLFNYLSQTTPTDVSIAKLDIDMTANTLHISGTATGLNVVNQYTDTLKFTKYTTKENKDQVNAFSNVVLTGFTRDNKSATYDITLGFDPLIFSGAEEVVLTVPEIISTRSEVDKPNALFQTQGAH